MPDYGINPSHWRKMAAFSLIFVFVAFAFFSTSPSKSGVDAVSSRHWTERFEKELTTTFEEFHSEKLLPLKDSLRKAQKLSSMKAMAAMKSLGIDWTKATSDPEVNMGPKEIIQRWDYPVEEYDVITDDGYILKVQRIPGPRRLKGELKSSNSSFSGKAKPSPNLPKPVLFLMHGLLGAATNWIANLPNQSFAFLAADAGFDVWLGNARGNTYSRRHTQFSPKDSDFWKFSWDEIAKFDIDAMVKFALFKTGQPQLYYAGHSQGSLVMFAHASEDLEFGKKIKEFYALGPVTTVGKVIGAARLFGKIHSLITAGSWITGVGEFLPKNAFIDMIAKQFCTSKLQVMCTNILFIVAGADTDHLNTTRLPVYMTHTPAGTSAQNVVHFGQMISSSKFQKHDYGFLGNLWRYQSYKAPQYVVSRMEVPTVLFWGGKDILADPEDVQSLIPKIKNLKGNYFSANLDHLDYIWGNSSADEVYNPIIRMMKKQEGM